MKHLVLAGAGHAHMVTIQNIAAICKRGHKVTVVGHSERHYYSGMGPGMLGGSYSPEQISFNSRKTVEAQGGIFIQGNITSIDPEHKVLCLESGKSIEYDILSCNLGSITEQTFPTGDNCPVFTVKPIENLIAAKNYLLQEGRNRHLKVAIIGGGPSAAELSGNIVQLAENERLLKPMVTVYCRRGFMSRFAGKVQDSCHAYLQKQGVVIRENFPVDQIDRCTLSNSNSSNNTADLVLLAHGVVPPPIFQSSGIETGGDGGMAVNEFLQSTSHPEIFGGGDCICFCKQPLDKVGVYAVRQNTILYQNLLSALTAGDLKRFSPGGDYLLIFNLGRKYGVLQKGFVFWQGKLAFMIKNSIDQRFMNRFK